MLSFVAKIQRFWVASTLYVHTRTAAFVVPIVWSTRKGQQTVLQKDQFTHFRMIISSGGCLLDMMDLLHSTVIKMFLSVVVRLCC